MKLIQDLLYMAPLLPRKSRKATELLIAAAEMKLVPLQEEKIVQA